MSWIEYNTIWISPIFFSILKNSIIITEYKREYWSICRWHIRYVFWKIARENRIVLITPSSRAAATDRSIAGTPLGIYGLLLLNESAFFCIYNKARVSTAWDLYSSVFICYPCNKYSNKRKPTRMSSRTVVPQQKEIIPFK